MADHLGLFDTPEGSEFVIANICGYTYSSNMVHSVVLPAEIADELDGAMTRGYFEDAYTTAMCVAAYKLKLPCFGHEDCINYRWTGMGQSAIETEKLRLDKDENGTHALFASETISKGDLLGFYTGEVFPCNHQNPEWWKHRYHLVIPNTKYAIDAQRFGSAMRLLKTSDNGNCKPRCFVQFKNNRVFDVFALIAMLRFHDEDEDLGVQDNDEIIQIKMAVIATKDIKPGDKLAFEPFKEKFFCACGTKGKCPHYIPPVVHRSDTFTQACQRVKLSRIFQQVVTEISLALRNRFPKHTVLGNLDMAYDVVFADLHAWYFAANGSRRRFVEFHHYRLALDYEGHGRRWCSLCKLDYHFENQQELVAHFHDKHMLPCQKHECNYCRYPSSPSSASSPGLGKSGFCKQLTIVYCKYVREHAFVNRIDDPNIPRLMPQSSFEDL